VLALFGLDEVHLLLLLLDLTLLGPVSFWFLDLVYNVPHLNRNVNGLWLWL
jgi:hypothetical protein